jgi:putative ABC transport system permease protein
MTLVAVGAVIGVLAAIAIGRVVAGLLFGVSATDPLTYASVTAVLAVLAVVAFGACYLPALRAARVNPMSALRRNRIEVGAALTISASRQRP